MLETVRKLFNSSVIEDQMLGIELAKELNINDLISLFPEVGSHFNSKLLRHNTTCYNSKSFYSKTDKYLIWRNKNVVGIAYGDSIDYFESSVIYQKYTKLD